MLRLFLLSVVLTGSTFARDYINAPTSTSKLILDSIEKCGSSDPAAMLKMIEQGQYRHDDDFKELVHCTYSRAGLSDENGRVKMDQLLKAFPGSAGVSKALASCDQRGPTPRDSTFLSFSCFLDSTPILIRYPLE